MLTNFLPQYLGFPHMSPAWFGQPGVYGFGGSFGYPAGPSVVVQQPYPSNGTTHPFFSAIGIGGTPYSVQQIIPLLGQLAQQISVQGAVSQQIAYVLHHLALLSSQLLVQFQPFVGAGQAFGLGVPFPGQYLTPTVFAGAPQGGFGFNPQQAQAWGASRPQTIQ